MNLHLASQVLGWGLTQEDKSVSLCAVVVAILSFPQTHVVLPSLVVVGLAGIPHGLVNVAASQVPHPPTLHCRVRLAGTYPYGVSGAWSKIKVSTRVHLMH